jgi:hypothetical protein
MAETEQREARRDFADRRGMIGPYGVRYSWAYWLLILGAFAMLVVDLLDDAAVWNLGVILLLVIAVAIQPGGFRGPRHAARAEQKRRADAGGA